MLTPVDDPLGAALGFLEEDVVDAPNIVLGYEYEMDESGNLVAVPIESKVAQDMNSGEDDDCCCSCCCPEPDCCLTRIADTIAGMYDEEGEGDFYRSVFDEPAPAEFTV